MRDNGSLDVTGIAMVDRSLPTFFRKKDIILGGGPEEGGISVRRVTCARGSGVSF